MWGQKKGDAYNKGFKIAEGYYMQGKKGWDYFSF